MPMNRGKKKELLMQGYTGYRLCNTEILSALSINTSTTTTVFTNNRLVK